MLKDCHSQQNYKETEYKDTGMTENKQVAEIVIQHIAYSSSEYFPLGMSDENNKQQVSQYKYEDGCCLL